MERFHHLEALSYRPSTALRFRRRTVLTTPYMRHTWRWGPQAMLAYNSAAAILSFVLSDPLKMLALKRN